jgi:hypothetical protein
VGITHLFSFQVWCYLAILIAAHTYQAFERAKAQEVERAELQQARAASELQMLKSQLHPHYLFNTLNGITTLIDSDRTKAKASVLKLSNLLRTSLEYGNSDLIPFAEELKFVKSYLELEQMRLEDRLQVTWDIDFETREMLVPQLISSRWWRMRFCMGSHAAAKEAGFRSFPGKSVIGWSLKLGIASVERAKKDWGSAIGIRRQESSVCMRMKEPLHSGLTWTTWPLQRSLFPLFYSRRGSRRSHNSSEAAKEETNHASVDCG